MRDAACPPSTRGGRGGGGGGDLEPADLGVAPAARVDAVRGVHRLHVRPQRPRAERLDVYQLLSAQAPVSPALHAARSGAAGWRGGAAGLEVGVERRRLCAVSHTRAHGGGGERARRAALGVGAVGAAARGHEATVQVPQAGAAPAPVLAGLAVGVEEGAGAGVLEKVEHR